jgi:hypothetical protein
MKKAEKKSFKAAAAKVPEENKVSHALPKSATNKKQPFKWMETFKVLTFAYLPHAPDEHDDVNYGNRSISLISLSSIKGTE